MFTKTVDSKPLIKLPTGVTIRDLTVSIFDQKNRGATVSSELYKIPESAACRPDLLSIFFYGDEEQTEMVLKLNGISNPFRLMPGEVVSLPYISDLNRLTKTEMASSYGDEKGKIEPEDKNKNSYKYIKPNNIKEILANQERNRDFESLKIPKGLGLPYVSKDDSPIKVDKNTGRFVITGKPLRQTPSTPSQFDPKSSIDYTNKIDELANEAASEECISLDGETTSSIAKGKNVY